MRPRKNPKPGSRGKGPSTTSASSSSKPGLPGFDIKFEDVPLDEQHTFPTALLDHAYVDSLQLNLAVISS